MNADIKKRWVEELRSGNYRQGVDGLRSSDDKYCCLGVLCEIAVADGVVTRKRGGSGYYAYASVVDPIDASRRCLPTSVAAWAGLDRQDPIIKGRGLANWNDVANMNFTELAYMIEENL